jgi:DNA polymerase-3 subunit delta'
MSFADFPEEKQVVQLLQRSLARGRLAHAYLFMGSGLGELENMARTLAKALNCQNPIERGTSGLSLDSCDQCPSCRKIAEDAHGDVQWVRPESKSRVITIDQIRELMQSIYLKPSQAEFKVAILVAADRLNVQAGNAFLKTLEEPPAKSILILLSTEPQRLLETLFSRCLRLNFASEGRFRISDKQNAWIESFSEMAAREQKGLLSRYRLLSVLLGQLAGIKAEIERTLTSRSPLERHADIEPKLRDRWEEELSAAIEAEYRRHRAEVLLGLQWWLRDVWLQTMNLGKELLSFPKLENAAQSIAQRISTDDAMENLNLLEQTQRSLSSNVQEGLALEVGLLRLKL